MSTTSARKSSARKRPARLRDQRIELLDRNGIAWKDEQGTWQGFRDSDTYLHSCAPIHLQLTAVCDALDGPYLWIGIKGPFVEHGLCYGIVGRESLLKVAREILRYAPRKTTRQKSQASADQPTTQNGIGRSVNPKRATRHLPRR